MGEAAEDLISGRCNPDGTWADWYINGDDSESAFWKRARDNSRQKKESNAQWSMNFLREQGVKFELKNPSNYHCIVGEFDFYPSTGLYVHRISKKKGRGVKNLLAIIKKNENS